MVCRPWKHKWVDYKFTPSGARCAKCQQDKRLNYKQRKARYRRIRKFIDSMNKS